MSFRLLPSAFTHARNPRALAFCFSAPNPGSKIRRGGTPDGFPARAERGALLLEKLELAGHYPYSDLDRTSRRCSSILTTSRAYSLPADCFAEFGALYCAARAGSIGIEAQSIPQIGAK